MGGGKGEQSGEGLLAIWASIGADSSSCRRTWVPSRRAKTSWMLWVLTTEGFWAQRFLESCYNHTGISLHSRWDGCTQAGNKCRQGCGGTTTLYTTGKNIKWGDALDNSLTVPQNCNTKLSQDLEIPLLCIHPREIKTYTYTKTCM